MWRHMYSHKGPRKLRKVLRRTQMGFCRKMKSLMSGWCSQCTEVQPSLRGPEVHHRIRASEKADKILDGRVDRNDCYSVDPPTTQSIGEYVSFLISAHGSEAYLLWTQKGQTSHQSQVLRQAIEEAYSCTEGVGNIFAKFFQAMEFKKSFSDGEKILIRYSMLRCYRNKRKLK